METPGLEATVREKFDERKTQKYLKTHKRKRRKGSKRTCHITEIVQNLRRKLKNSSHNPEQRLIPKNH
jgi:hypothetical protein